MTSNIESLPLGPRPRLHIRLDKARAPTAVGDARVSLGVRTPVPGRPDDEGVFVDWAWDGRQLVVRNDRYGMYPLFYCAKPDSICVATALEDVVRANSDRRYDHAALGVFHRMGHFIGADTPFEDIRFLPPNSVLSWADGVLKIDTQPARIGHGALQRMDFDEAVETYIRLFAQAIERRAPQDEFAIPLSGGRDSRHMLLELARQGHRPKFCATVRYRPPATNEDIRIARLLAQRFDVPHVDLARPTSFFEAELKELRLGNHCGGGHGWSLPVAAYLDGRAQVIYDGLAGSVLSGGFMQNQQKLQLFREHRFKDLAHLVLTENELDTVIERVLSKDFQRRIPLADAIERLVPELERHADLPNPMLSFVLWNRTRRCVATIPFAIYHRTPQVHVPYLDHELFDFLVSLDPSVVDGNRLHDETIRRAYPELADVPYEDKSARAAFGPDDRSYYPDARRAFLSHLRAAPSDAAAVLNRSYLFVKLGADLLRGRIESPWPMRTALQALERERLRLS